MWSALREVRQLALSGADNMNTFHWLFRGEARGGISLRLLSAILFWSISHDIGIFPFYLRSLHNISDDFLTRAHTDEIDRWDEARKFRQAQLPWRWKDFLCGIPKVSWFTEGVEQPRYSLATTKDNLSFAVAEWNASNGIGMQFFRDHGIWPLCIDFRAGSILPKLEGEGLTTWPNQLLRCVAGSAWSKTEIVKFVETTQVCKPEHCLLITPSHVTDDHLKGSANWTQAGWADSNLFDGFLCGAWNVYVKSPRTLTCFSNKPRRTPTITLNDKCKQIGHQLLPDHRCVVRHINIEHSSGLITTVQTAEGVTRLSVAPQLGPISLHEARKDKYQWPMSREDYRRLILEERIIMMGGLSEWCSGRPCEPADAADAWWRVYPLGLLEHALPEMLGAVVPPVSEIQMPRSAESAKDAEEASSPNHVELENRTKCDGTCQIFDPVAFRTGGVEPQRILDGLVNDALGPQKLEALFAVLSTNTITSYLRGWEHWCQFCSTRKTSPWIDTTQENWGEEILDFITYEGGILRLEPSTTRGKLSAVRYAHIIGGRADFSPYGLSYKLTLSGMDRNKLATGLLPYNTDLMHWVWANYIIGDAQISDRELWCALNLGFFLHDARCRVGELENEGFAFHLQRPETHSDGSYFPQ